MKTIRVRYFAILREKRGVSDEALQTQSATAAELYDELARKHLFSLEKPSLRVAINAEFSDWSHVLRDGDEVVFIPPVSGG